mgnify:CR=1 FL=1
MALTDSLISYWPLDEASGNALDAHGANELTETGGTIASATGKVGNARDFEAGDTESFQHADNADLSTGNIDFTFAAWVNAESLADFPVISHKGWGGSGIREWVLYYDTSAGRLTFSVSDDGDSTAGTVQADNFGALSTGTWYHVVWWHDSVNNQLGIAVNAGTPNTFSYSAGLGDRAGTFEIGASSVDQSLYWGGLFDEVGFWKRVLTSDERTDLYNSGAGRAYSYFQ